MDWTFDNTHLENVDELVERHIQIQKTFRWSGIFKYIKVIVVWGLWWILVVGSSIKRLEAPTLNRTDSPSLRISQVSIIPQWLRLMKLPFSLCTGMVTALVMGRQLHYLWFQVCIGHDIQKTQFCSGSSWLLDLIIFVPHFHNCLSLWW